MVNISYQSHSGFPIHSNVVSNDCIMSITNQVGSNKKKVMLRSSLVKTKLGPMLQINLKKCFFKTDSVTKIE